ncbi:hypothetical protein CEXT_263801, partial [Caerostris extrusa]
MGSGVSLLETVRAKQYLGPTSEKLEGAEWSCPSSSFSNEQSGVSDEDSDGLPFRVLVDRESDESEHYLPRTAEVSSFAIR